MNLLIFKWSADCDKRVCFADSDGGIKLRKSRLFSSKEAAEASLARKDDITVTMAVKSEPVEVMGRIEG